MAKEASAREDKFVELQEKKSQEQKEEALENERDQPQETVAPTLTAEKIVEEAKKEVTKEGKGAASAEEKEAKKKEEKPEEKPAKEEKKREIVLERVYSVPLQDAYSVPQSKRGDKAVRLLKTFLERHMKSQNVRLAVALNNAIRARGTRHPLKKVKVRATKDKAGLVLTELAA